MSSPNTLPANVARDAYEASFYEAMVGDIIGQRAEIQDLNYRLDHDPMTGLLNRTAWTRELTGLVDFAEKTGQDVGVLVIDLKDFKRVNDTNGHKKGDEVIEQTADVIRQVASILTSTLRSQDDFPDVIGNATKFIMDEHGVAHLAGDEFAVALLLSPGDLRRDTDFTPQQRLDRTRKRLITAFHEREDITSTGVDISVGGAVRKQGMTAEQLIREADIKMYEHKQEQVDVSGSYR